MSVVHLFRFGLVLAGMVLLDSCKSTPRPQDDKALKIARIHLGGQIESFPNSSGEYMLYVQKHQTTSSTALKFVVIQSATLDIVAAQTFVPGYVKWVTETSLEVLSVPGILRSGDDLSNYRQTVSIRTPN